MEQIDSDEQMHDYILGSRNLVEEATLVITFLMATSEDIGFHIDRIPLALILDPDRVRNSVSYSAHKRFNQYSNELAY